MFVKLSLISIHVIFSFDFIVAIAQIPASKCMQIGWDQCNIHRIDISPGERIIKDDSCFVDRGSNVTISFNFTPRFETYNLKWAIWVETVVGDYKVEGIPSDARNFSYYPTLENKINPFETVIHIPNNIRTKLWIIRVTIMGDSDLDMCCFLCKIRVREPQMNTTVSSTIFDPTNPYDIIRKQVSFPSIWDFNEMMKNFQNDSNIFNKFVFDNFATTPKPSYLTMFKNAFKRLFGITSELTAIPKVPFLGNASSLMEYFNDAVLAGNDKKLVNQTVMSIAHETDVIEPKRTKGVITKETTFSDTFSSVKPEEGETGKNFKSDSESDHEDGVDGKAKGSENDSSVEDITITTTVQTTRTKPKIKTRTSLHLRNKIVKSTSVSKKVARAEVKKIVRPTRWAKPIAKSTTKR